MVDALFKRETGRAFARKTDRHLAPEPLRCARYKNAFAPEFAHCSASLSLAILQNTRAGGSRHFAAKRKRCGLLFWRKEVNPRVFRP